MDNQYIQLVLSGKTDAFRYLVEKYQNRALAVAYSVVKNRETAEDMVQESFVKAYRALANFRGDASFSTWFLRIVVNESIRYIEREKLQANYCNEMGNVNEHDINSSLKNMLQEEQQKYIELAINQMPPREALMLQLFYIDDLSLKEIEETINLNTDHIKVLLHRARKQLFTILQKELKHEVTSLL